MSKKFRVVIPPSVKKDLRDIVEYYYEVNQQYSRKIFGKIVERISELEGFPEKGRVVPELRDHNIVTYKELIEEPYRIIYKISNEEILIVAVIDGRRNVEEILIRKLQRK
jgi:addiction module RelE/StbE family toxin